MKSNIERMEHKREEIRLSKTNLQKLEMELKEMEDKCVHNVDSSNWDTAYTPERIAAQGSDWRASNYEPERVIDKWTMTCKVCGKVKIIY